MECSVRMGLEMCRTDGAQGIQLRVNIYPAPDVSDLVAISGLISDVVENYEI